MKIVKVQRRWKLHEHGFVVAIRFENHSKEVAYFEQKLRDTYGPEALYTPDGYWRSHWGTPVYHTTQWGHRQYSRPYFIGFRNEADISAALLMMGAQ